MKILMVHNYYQIPGGEDTVFKNEVKLLRAHNHEVYEYTRNNSEINSFSIFRKLFLPFTAIFSVKTFIELKKKIKEQRIEIVHVHNTLTLISPAVFYASKVCKIPVVQTLHNFRMLCPGATFFRDGRICEECIQKGPLHAVKHKCYRNSVSQTFVNSMILMVHRLTRIYRYPRFICLTEFNKEKLLHLNRKKLIIELDKVFIKPNFIEKRERIIPYANRKDQSVYVGRLEKQKGIDRLLMEWKKQKDRKLIICGTGPLEEWCHNFVKENRMDNVLFYGQVSHERVMELLSESKAFVFPSICYEGLPMTILESYACGTPVYAEQIGNMKELLTEKVFTIKEGLKEEKFYAEENYEILNNIYQAML